MAETMLQSLNVMYHSYGKEPISRIYNGNCLLNGIKTKKYVPVLQRPKCSKYLE